MIILLSIRQCPWHIIAPNFDPTSFTFDSAEENSKSHPHSTRRPKRHAMQFQSPNSSLIHTNALGLQIRPRSLNLPHQFLVSLWYVVESEDTVSEFKKEVCAEGYKGPKGELNAQIRQ